jgi:hypothetical protein
MAVEELSQSFIGMSEFRNLNPDFFAGSFLKQISTYL